MSAWQTFYRPTSFADLNLKEVRENMQALAQKGKLGQVWLFTGPRGTGKTSTARILAAMMASKKNEKAIDNNFQINKGKKKLLPFSNPDLNDLEVKKILEGDSYSVIEIDAASHRGIDDVRQLQEQIMLPPTLSKMLVYILDEVHMFTTEAFNALLKTLEEPPQHCLFILATTEKHKVPATVISRCNLLEFRQAKEEELLEVFNKILQAEGLKAEDKALKRIANLAEGSFRDGVKLLQTVANHGEINLANVEKYLSSDYEDLLLQLVKAIKEKDQLAIAEFFSLLRQKNINENYFYKNFLEFLYQELLGNLQQKKNLSLNQSQAQFLLEQFVELKGNAMIPFLDLELKILQILQKSKSKK